MVRLTLPLLLLPIALALSATSAAHSNGQALFSSNCVSCHAANGKGAFPAVPDLATRMTKTDTQLISSTLNGFKSKGSAMAMPPKGGNPKITAADAAAVIVYVRSLVKSRVAIDHSHQPPGDLP